MNRLHNLDYLRGLAAFGIMIFHYSVWSFGGFSAETFMGRLGLYGVSIFYILSGLTLYYVYRERMKPSKEDTISFFRKRLFRILPLLWLATIVTILISKRAPDLTNVFLNLTGLYGFIRWDKYFAVGAWSIGNELVFYVFFPVFMLLINRSRLLMALLSVAIFGLYLYFAFVRLDSDTPILQQWANYVNPFNQVFLFLGGVLIGLFFHKTKFRGSVSLGLLLAALVLFIIYPTEGDLVNIVTGVNRLVFTAICFAICIGFFKLTWELPPFLHKPLTLLGEASYSVYLLHPIVWVFTGITLKMFHKLGIDVSPHVKISLSILLTLIASHFVYNYFELYFMRFGRSRKHKLPKQEATYQVNKGEERTISYLSSSAAIREAERGGETETN